MQHSLLGTAKPRRIPTPVQQRQPFERGRIVCLGEAGSTYRRVAAHVGHNVSGVVSLLSTVVCGTFPHPRPGSGRPRSTDARQDRRIVLAAVAARIASRKKYGHMLHLLCPQGTLGTIYLQQDSDHVCLWLGYHLHHATDKHGYSGVVKVSTREWNGDLLSSVMRVGSVCMRVMYVHMYGVDVVTVIFRSIFAHDTWTPPQAS